ncbi:MAG: hypothetical protein LBL65_07960 [Campylobacteraceae bacterium]|jgi:hypothetical protein|nr:hypothetical protein [Campylobacteraceae bacterium]
MKVQSIIFSIICLISFALSANVEVASNETINANTTVSLKAPLPNDGTAHTQETQSGFDTSCSDCEQ